MSNYALNRVMDRAMRAFDRDLITVADVYELSMKVDQSTSDEDISWQLTEVIERNRDANTAIANTAFGSGYNTAMGWND